MDTKWKNMSRTIVFWVAILAILGSTYVAVLEFGHGIQKLNARGGADLYTPYDYIRNVDFEHSDAYQEVFADIDTCIIDEYMTTGSLDGLKKSLDNIDYVTVPKQGFGVKMIVTKRDGTQKELRYGEKQEEAKKDNDNVTIHSESTIQKEKSDDGEMAYVEEHSIRREDSKEWFWDGNSWYEKDSDDVAWDEIENTSTITVDFTASEQTVASFINDWTYQENMVNNFMRNIISAGLIFVFGFLCLLISASPQNRTAAGRWLDRIWLEVLLVAWCIFITLTIGLGIIGFDAFATEQVDRILIPLGIGISAGVYVCCMGVVSIVRRAKEHQFIKSSACYKALHFMKQTLIEQKREWDYWKEKESSTLTVKGKEMKRKRWNLIFAGIVSIIGSIISLMLFALPLALLAIVGMAFIFYSMWSNYRKDIADLLDHEKILHQIYEISNGNLQATTDIKEDSIYYRATKELEEIGQGMKRSVEEQLKVERLKIELITNVSHDLKTPLTSIISYVDLLSKDESLSEEAKDYVEILGRKSERLKNIVIDLFDLAKSTSGDISVDLSTLDMKKFVEQMLVEMEDKIQASGFEIITDYRAEKAKFDGDPNRMYRVVQNIMENALKYSLKGSRIYIRVEEEDEKWKLSVKNTASYRMDFTEEEIMERFARGDKARSQEGNGLGLSIAESFTQLCGGEFKIEIDGDQFTAMVLFPKHIEE